MTADEMCVAQLVAHLGWELTGDGEYEDPGHTAWLIMERDLSIERENSFPLGEEMIAKNCCSY